MCDLRINSREFQREFIELYRENECLWKVKSSIYMNKELKMKAYEKLRDKLLEIDQTATVDTAKKKINTLRTNFRAELKKVNNSKKSGVGEDEIYQPSLWYFKELLFLTDQETPRTGLSSRRGNESLPDLMIQDEESLHAGDDIDSIIPSTANQTTSFSRRKRSRDNSIEQAQSVLRKVQEKLSNVKEDEFDIYGKHIACEIRGLPEDSRIYIQKIINDSMFEAKMGRAKQLRLVLEEEQQTNAFYEEPSFPEFVTKWQ